MDAARAGWYRQGDRARYWDGAAWTEQYRALPPAVAAPTGDPIVEPATPAASSSKRRQAALITGIGAAAVAIGCFLPWVEASAPFVGTITRSGVDGGGDGVIFLGLAAVLAGVAYKAWTGEPGRRSQVLAGLLIVALGAMALFEVNDTSSRLKAAQDASDLITPSYGSGLVLIAAGIVAAVVGWFQMPWSKS